jgi:hypothetical protein
MADKQLNNTERVRGRPWPKGVSGNPKGRPPKGHSITEMIMSMMDEKPEIKRGIGEKIIQLANNGDVQAIKMLWAYIDGEPIRKQVIDSDSGIKVSIVDYGTNPKVDVDK